MNHYHQSLLRKARVLKNRKIFWTFSWGGRVISSSKNYWDHVLPCKGQTLMCPQNFSKFPPKKYGRIKGRLKLFGKFIRFAQCGLPFLKLAKDYHYQCVGLSLTRHRISVTFSPLSAWLGWSSPQALSNGCALRIEDCGMKHICFITHIYMKLFTFPGQGSLALGDRFGLFIQTLNNAEKLFIQLKNEWSPT